MYLAVNDIKRRQTLTINMLYTPNFQAFILQALLGQEQGTWHGENDIQGSTSSVTRNACLERKCMKYIVQEHRP